VSRRFFIGYSLLLLFSFFGRAAARSARRRAVRSSPAFASLGVASASIALARFAPYTQKMADKIFKAFAAIHLVFKGFYTWF
jgi:hypothetical protein